MQRQSGVWTRIAAHVLFLGACNQIAGIGPGTPGQCSTIDDCRVEENECHLALACNEGFCDFDNLPAGTLLAKQTVGDCLETTCDGKGYIISSFVAEDIEDDENPCTEDLCTDNGPAHQPKAQAECYDGPEQTKGRGLCKAGVQLCSDGKPVGECTDQVLPKAETCLSLYDEDCDGLANEEGINCACVPGQVRECYTGTPQTKDVGICHAGKQACRPDGLGYGDCFEEQLPTEETCDAAMIDEDCDGFSNESGKDCVCGDGYLSSAQEDCDDGNTVDGDECPASCRYSILGITSFGSHTCAMIDIPALKCWGANTHGQLGIGNTQHRGDQQSEMDKDLPAIDLGDAMRASAVAAGSEHTCALRQDGSVKCWGHNEFGQLGLGHTNDRGDQPNEMGNNLLTAELSTSMSATAIAAGSEHSCAILQNGSIKCWGHNNYGQLGVGHTSDRGDEPDEMGDFLSPVDLGTGLIATTIAAGSDHTCTLLQSGSVKCWGRNDFGQLGLGDTNHRGDQPNEMGNFLSPVDLGADNTATAIAAGSDHTCAILQNGSVKCWGRNDFGQLGRGDKLHRGDQPNEMGNFLSPVDLGTGLIATAIAAGGDHTCAILQNGSIKCWGRNDFGQLGRGDKLHRGDEAGEMGNFLPPILLKSSQTIALGITAGKDHICALLLGGDLKCWGGNTLGELGLGDTLHRGDNPNEVGDPLPKVMLW